MAKPKVNPPTVTDEHLLQGEKECLLNAQRLIDDAKLLGLHGRYRAGYLMAHLACEEIGKSMWLRISRTSGEEMRNEWWNRFTNHPDKQAATLLAWAQVHHPEEYKSDYKSFYKRINITTKNLFKFRNQATYVDFDIDKKEFVPVLHDAAMEKHFLEELQFAELLTKWVS